MDDGALGDPGRDDHGRRAQPEASKVERAEGFGCTGAARVGHARVVPDVARGLIVRYTFVWRDDVIIEAARVIIDNQQ